MSVKAFSLTGGGGDLSLSLLRGAKRGGGVGLFNRTLLFVVSALGFGRGPGAGDEENVSRMERVNLGLGSGGVDRCTRPRAVRTSGVFELPLRMGTLTKLFTVI